MNLIKLWFFLRFFTMLIVVIILWRFLNKSIKNSFGLEIFKNWMQSGIHFKFTNTNFFNIRMYL